MTSIASTTTTATTVVGREAQGDKGGTNGSSKIMLGSRNQQGGTAITRQRTHGHGRSTRFAANPATKIPRERIEQYSRFRSTPVIHQTTSRRESEVELRVLPSRTLLTAAGTEITFGPHQPPKYLPATRSAPQLTPEMRMAGATDPLSITHSPNTRAEGNSSRRLSATLTRTGTRHSDRTGRRLSTTSSHATAHSWYGASGVLANLPTPGLLSSLAGAAHYTGNPKFSRQDALRASFGDREVILEDQRKQTLDDVLELFCSHPSLEIFERSWHRDAVFEDPLTKCIGYREYAAQWFALPKLVPTSTTIQHRVLSSTHYPHRIVFDQTQEYNIRFLKRKKIIQSLVTLELDEDGKIIKMEDRWNGEEMPRRWGALWLRRLNGKAMPLFVRVPRRAPERTPTPV
ncbi:hypothetical protein FRC09_004553 [Ceratobasidium sp. 395]|nr:hypothetical protein FRC09_004553 [Ceratobasidium sp. 395]